MRDTVMPIALRDVPLYRPPVAPVAEDAALEARGAYWKDLGNTPGHVNHWTRQGFFRFIKPHFDIVATPAGHPVAMVHANNGTSELAAWVGVMSAGRLLTFFRP